MEFPVLHYTGVLKRWKKKTLLFVEEGFKLIDKSLPNSKSNDMIYFLKNAIILENIKNNKTLEISLRKGRIFIQAFSPKEKQIIKEKLRQHITKINETNIFSQEFEDYLSEINKQDEDNPSDDIFKNIQSTISLMINFFLELNQKIDDFKTLIDTSKLGKTLRANFTDCYNKMTFIETKMKAKFDELVKTLYDYHDFLEPMMTEEITKSMSGRLSQNPNEFDFNRKRTSKSIKNLKTINIDSSEDENETGGKEENINNKQNKEKNKEIKNEEKKEKEKEKEKKIVLFKEDPIYNFEKRTKLSKKIEVNKNMIPEIVKLISSGQKVLPIQFNEPLNTLQRECERFIFCDLLNKAADEKTPEMKMAYITAFLTAEMSMSIGRVLKPMIPLVGETFEYVDNNLHYRFFGEEVQRLPSHVSAYIAEGDKWKYWADNRNTTSFRFFAGAYAVDFGNKIHVELLNMNKKGDKKFDTFVYNRPSTLLKGILVNNLHYDYNGSVTMTSPDYPDIICTVEYVADNNEEGIIRGNISKGDNIIYNIAGNWKKEIYITDSNEENKKVLFTVKEEDFFKNSLEGYIIPQYSCNLNYITDKLKEVLPVSDTRFRPDQKEYEIGSTDKSQEIKKVIEEMQKYKQEILDKNKKEHIPIYFENEYNEESKDFVFMYKGGYWKDRANKKLKLKDVFDTTEFEKELAKRQKEKEKENNNK